MGVQFTTVREQRTETGFFSRQYWREDNFSPAAMRRMRSAAVLAMISVEMLVVQIGYSLFA
ncbi:MAG: hypothetical protein OXN84_07880 [Albidovulum sp.]|nr:hypothetical protein [Albidovulum sp.]